MDLQIYNCTYHLRLKVRVGTCIQVSTELFFIKVYLMFYFLNF